MKRGQHSSITAHLVRRERQEALAGVEQVGARRRCDANPSNRPDKRAYTSRGQAERAAAAMGGADGVSLWAYRCVYCGQWHLTSQERNLVAEESDR